MRILIALTYFQPYKSGLTVYAVRQARALAALGHQVTVLTSQYDPSLAEEAWDEGVQIIRMPVVFRLSKAVVMPRMPFAAWKLMADADIVNLHLPQADAALLTLLAKLRRKPVVITYHCDLDLPSGWINRLAGWAAALANRFSVALADVIVHNTRDYAENSPFLKRYLDKLSVIKPPIEVMAVSENDLVEFREKHDIKPGQRIIGMVARFATEKGIEYLVQAMPKILGVLPEVRVMFVGAYQNVIGEEKYRAKLWPLIESLGRHWTFFGVVSEFEKAVFYHLCEVLVLPSINSTESFGMVQVEAMLCGTPVVASDLPGVRQPVSETGMGTIVPMKDANALADAIINILNRPDDVEPGEISMMIQDYSSETAARAYQALYEKLVRDHE